MSHRPRLTVAPLECRSVPAASVVAFAAAEQARPDVALYDAAAGTVTRTYTPYADTFRGGIRVAVAAAGAEQLAVVGAGPGGGPHVQVSEVASGKLLSSFYAYEPGFRGGVYVQAADLDGDGRLEVVAGTGDGGGPRVTVYDALTGKPKASFMAYAASFRGGVRVAVGDVTGDGSPDLVTMPGPGGGPHFRVFDPAGAELGSFFAGDPASRTGGYIAAGDVDGDGVAEVLVGADAGGPPTVRVVDARTGAEKHKFDAFAANFRGGVRVGATAGAAGRDLIVVAPGPAAGAAGPPRARLLHASGAEAAALTPLAGRQPGGLNVAGSPARPVGVRTAVLPAGGEPFADITVTGLRWGAASVVFADGAGFREEVAGRVTRAGRLTVRVPAYADPATGRVRASPASLTATAVQDRAAGSPKPFRIADLPAVAGGPGAYAVGSLDAAAARLDAAGGKREAEFARATRDLYRLAQTKDVTLPGGDGKPTTLTAADLDSADRMLAALDRRVGFPKPLLRPAGLSDYSGLAGAGVGSGLGDSVAASLRDRGGLGNAAASMRIQSGGSLPPGVEGGPPAPAADPDFFEDTKAAEKHFIDGWVKLAKENGDLATWVPGKLLPIRSLFNLLLKELIDAVAKRPEDANSPADGAYTTPAPAATPNLEPYDPPPTPAAPAATSAATATTVAAATQPSLDDVGVKILGQSQSKTSTTGGGTSTTRGKCATSGNPFAACVGPQ